MRRTPRQSSRLIARAMAILVLLASVALTGCDTADITMRILDFDSSQVEGVRVWIHDEVNDEYVEALTVVFEEVGERLGDERVTYSMWSEGVEVSPRMEAVVVRDGSNADEVVLRMPLLPVPGVGEYRISSFNTVGDSGLSEDSFQI